MSAQSSENPSRRSLLRRIVRIFFRSVLTIFIILLIVIFLVQTPYVQNIVRGKAERYLSRRLKTPVRIGQLNIAFFSSVTLKGVYVEDLRRDTLLSAGLIDVHLRMLGLLHNRLDIDEIALGDLTANVSRRAGDSVFNYQFIVDAFAGKPTATPAKPKGAPMEISVRRLALDHIRLVYSDSLTGTFAMAAIGRDRTVIDSFDLNHLDFRLSELDLQNTLLAFRRSAGALSTSLRFGRLHTRDLGLDLRRLFLQSGDLQLDSATYVLDNGAKALNSGATVLDNGATPRSLAGMDYAHLVVSGLNFHVRRGSGI